MLCPAVSWRCIHDPYFTLVVCFATLYPLLVGTNEDRPSPPERQTSLGVGYRKHHQGISFEALRNWWTTLVLPGRGTFRKLRDLRGVALKRHGMLCPSLVRPIIG